MKCTIAMALGVLALTSGLAQAQTPAAPAGPYDYILAAAPANQRADATVIKWKPDFTYDTLKKGTNKMVCYDRSGFPLQQPFSIECTSTANLDRVAQNLKAEATGDKAKSEAMLAEFEKNGTRVKPEYGSVFFHLMGADKEHVRQHMTVALPGATTASTGIPDKPGQGGAWIMNAGTTTAHLMVPGE